MQISIKGHQISVTAALQNYVHAQLARLEARLDRATHVVVLIAGKKNGEKNHRKLPSISIQIHFANRQMVIVKDFMRRTAKDFYSVITAAFDAVGTKLERRAGASDKKHHHRERKAMLRNKSIALA